MPAFADDTVVPADDTQATVTQVSDDADVQAAYDAFVAMEAALEAKDLAALVVASNQLEKITDDFTDDQYEAWNGLFSDEASLERYLDVLISTMYVTYTAEMAEAYQANPNAKTAMEFVEAYELTVEAEMDMEGFIPDIAAVYEAAKADMPSENVLTVYNAFVELQAALQWSIDDLQVAVDAFYDGPVDAFNELTDEELNDLALLLEVEDGEAAWNLVLSDWVDANVLLAVNDVYLAYVENPNEETAAAVVEYYGYIYGEDAVYGEEFAAIVDNLISDFINVYEEAVELLAAADEPATEDETPADTTETVDEAEDTEDTEKAPATGDTTSMLPFAGLIAAAAAMVALKKKNA